MSATSFIIDSAYTPVIKYTNTDTSTWHLIQTVGEPEVYDSTLSEANGAGASVVFDFTGETRIVEETLMFMLILWMSQGTQVFVIGSLLAQVAGQLPASTIYSLDNLAPVEYDLRSVPDDYDGSQLDGVTFYSSGMLDLGRHQLLINVTTASVETPYALDYIAYSSSAEPFVPNPSSASNSSSSSSPSQNTTSSHSSTPVGAIVGGVVGGVVLLASLLALSLFCRRQKRRKEDEGFLAPGMFPLMCK